jgi:hypothetical protein
LVPYLLLPIAVSIGKSASKSARALKLTDWVFGMALVMQLGGMYTW